MQGLINKVPHCSNFSINMRRGGVVWGRGGSISLISDKAFPPLLDPYVEFSHLLVRKGERVGDPMVDLVSVAEANLDLLQ